MQATVTVHEGKRGPQQWSMNDPVKATKVRAHDALKSAADKICQREYARAQQWASRHGRKHVWYTVPVEATALIEMMPQVLAGKVSPEAAMAMLWTYDIQKARGLI